MCSPQIYGPYNNSGETISGLDNCNGTTQLPQYLGECALTHTCIHAPGKYHDDGNGLGETYRYYATEHFPYIVRKP